MNWVYMPPWSPHVIAVTGVVLFALAVLRLRRERRGLWPLAIRATVIAALLWIAMNPTAYIFPQKKGKPKLIVLIDTSASMLTRDVAGESRLSAALAALTNQSTLGTLNREFTMEMRQFDRAARAAEVTSELRTGDASDIATALNVAIADLADKESQAGVLLISDGRATTPGSLEAADLALARSVPLWACALGGPIPRQDLWMETASSEVLAFNGAEVELAATLRSVGYPYRSFNVEILKSDTVINSQEVRPETNGVGRVSLRVKAPDSGEHRYTFRAAPQPEETDVVNNERSIFLRAIGEKARVLIAEGQPHWETKFLVQSLKRDPHVDVTAVYRLNANRHVAVVSSGGTQTRVEKDLFPRTQQAINAFDLIVLGRGSEAFFDSTTEQLLTDFVTRRGGSLVFARGKPYGGRFQPLGKFEPVAWGEGAATEVKLRPTAAGRDHPVFDLGSGASLDELIDRLPSFDQVSVTLGEKPLAVVLATGAHPESPVLLAYQRYGQGKALSVNAAGLWRWSFGETRQDQNDSAYHRFWISMLQWLLGGSQFLPGADIGLSSARRYYTSEQPMQFVISVRNIDRNAYQARLTISGEGRSVEIEPRPRGEMFVAEAGPFPPGKYEVKLRSNVGTPAELSQSVEVVSASIENRELSADPGLMRQIAERSAGRVISLEKLAALPETVRNWETSRQLAHEKKSVWDRPWILMGLVVLLGVEWWLRRQEGLL